MSQHSYSSSGERDKSPVRASTTTPKATPGKKEIKRFNKRTSAARTKYFAARQNMLLYSWIPHQGALSSLTGLKLPKTGDIPDLVSWIFGDTPVRKISVLLFVYDTLASVSDGRMERLSHDAFEILAGNNHANLENWLADHHHYPKRTLEALKDSDRLIFRELWKTYLPLAISTIQNNLGLLFILVRINMLGQTKGSVLSVGLDEMIDDDLLRVQARSFQMYPIHNNQEDMVVQLVEQILQTYLTRRTSRRSQLVHVSLQGAAWHETGKDSVAQTITKCAQELNDGFRICVEVQRLITLPRPHLVVEKDAKTPHTLLAKWVETVALSLLGRRPDCDIGLNSVFYSQICDLISKEMKVMILQKKFISIQIRIPNPETGEIDEEDRPPEPSLDQLLARRQAADKAVEEADDGLPPGACPPSRLLNQKRHLSDHATTRDRYLYWKQRYLLEKEEQRKEAELNKPPSEPPRAMLVGLMPPRHVVGAAKRPPPPTFSTQPRARPQPSNQAKSVEEELEEGEQEESPLRIPRPAKKTHAASEEEESGEELAKHMVEDTGIEDWEESSPAGRAGREILPSPSESQEEVPKPRSRPVRSSSSSERSSIIS